MTTTENIWVIAYAIITAMVFGWATLARIRFRKAENLLRLMEVETKASNAAIQAGDREGYLAHNDRFWALDAQLTKLLWN